MMQPPDIEIPAHATNGSNVSTIKNDDTMEELLNSQNLSTNPRGDGASRPSTQPQGFAINPNATPVASGDRNRILTTRYSIPSTPASRQHYIGTPVGLQGGFFNSAPAVPTYVGYQEPIPTSNLQKI